MYPLSRHCAAALLLLAALIVAPLGTHPVRADSISAIADVRALAGLAEQDEVYVASSQAIYRATGAPYATWTSQMSLTGTITALSPDPLHPNIVVFAAIQSSPYSSAVYRSDDGGRTAVVSTGATGVTALARPVQSSRPLYAGASDQSTGYIYRSNDAGLSWTTVYSVPSDGPANAAVTHIAVDPLDPAHIVATVSVYHGGFIVESLDNGATWHVLPTPAGTTLMAPTALAMNSTSRGDLWVAWGVMGDGLLAHSLDSGLHWTEVTAGLPASPYVTSIAHDMLSHRTYIDVLGQGVPHRLYASRDGVHFEQFAPDAVEIGSQMSLMSRAGYVITGDDSHPLWTRSIIGPLHWSVAAPFGHYYASVNAARLLGRPLSPTTACGGRLCQIFEKALLKDGTSTSTPTYGSITQDLLTLRAAVPIGGITSTITYASLAPLAQAAVRVAPPAHFHGGVILVKGGTFVPYSSTLRRAAGQVVAPYFWRYLNDSKVTPGGWLHDVGLPLTKVVDAVVSKGPSGIRRIYLQAFQNTILTYDPLNAPAWRVERANVGVDYAALLPGRIR